MNKFFDDENKVKQILHNIWDYASSVSDPLSIDIMDLCVRIWLSGNEKINTEPAKEYTLKWSNGRVTTYELI